MRRQISIKGSGPWTLRIEGEDLNAVYDIDAHTREATLRRDSLPPISSPIHSHSTPIPSNPKGREGAAPPCFVISLDRRPERWESFKKQSCFCPKEGWPFQFPIRWSATDGKEETPADGWGVGKPAWGTYLSHLRLFEWALSKNLDEIWVFEDDALFESGFSESYRRFREELPEDWEQVYLGGQHIRPKLCPPFSLSRHVYIPHNVNRLHAYGLSRVGMEKAVDFLKDLKSWTRAHADGYNHHIDHRFGVMHEQGLIRVYTPDKWLVSQGPNRSDIAHRKFRRRRFPPHSATASENWPGDKELPVIVLGSWSGGTSAVASLLHDLGVHIGNKFLHIRDRGINTYEAVGLVELVKEYFDEFTFEVKNPKDLSEGLSKWFRSRRREKPNGLIGAKYPGFSLFPDLLRRSIGPYRVILVDRSDEAVISSVHKRNWYVKPWSKMEGGVEGVVARMREGREKFVTTLPASHLLRVRYDDVVSNPREESNRIADWLGVRRAQPTHIDKELKTF